MNKGKPKMFSNYSRNGDSNEYLGSDGLPIYESYNHYLKQCTEFLTKAKKYRRDNLYLKGAVLHYEKFGYEGIKELEEEILHERDKHWEHYSKTFDNSYFDKDTNQMYENVKSQGRRIRVIREINESRVEEFSENFDKEKHCWFTRYCILSRFIQAARMIIIRNRLKKVLKILKYLTQEKIEAIENEFAKETGVRISAEPETISEITSGNYGANHPCCETSKQ